MDKEHVYEDGKPIIPLALKLLIWILCPVVWGCSTVPPCERFGYSVVHDNAGQQLVLFDMDNVDKLIALISGLAAGECRLPVDGEV